VSLVKQMIDRAFPPSVDSFFNEGPLNPIQVAANIAQPSDESNVPLPFPLYSLFLLIPYPASLVELRSANFCNLTNIETERLVKAQRAYRAMHVRPACLPFRAF